ncbi:MAG: efflux RND transporter periplasmic adaptor subunit [Verrucomicrobiae bacterium]|nr:efflux RND transporter periplasmic adaptor subunit [Verrucomicrobiae bacterium]
MPSPERPLDSLRIDRAGVEPEEPTRPSRWLIIVGLVVTAGACVTAYSKLSSVEVTTYTIRNVEPRGPRAALHASGYVTARREATVSSKITGRVVEVKIEEGQRVEQGQELARLDDSNIIKSLRLAEAQLQAALAAAAEAEVWTKNAELEYHRVKALADDRIASPSNLDRAEAEYRARLAQLETLRAQVEVAKREVAVWQQQLEDTVIRAPFAGIVTSKNAQPGEMISPISAGGGFTRTGICTIVDMESLEIEVDVSESYINRVHPGQSVEATLDAYPDWRIPAKVIAIIPTADKQKSTVKVRIGFEHLDPRILPQMAVKVAFRENPKEARHQSISIPKVALLKPNGSNAVFVVTNKQARLRHIVVGEAREDTITVTSGLSDGEKVVVESRRPLRDGVRVRERKP